MWPQADPADRELYVRVKQELAGGTGRPCSSTPDARTAVIGEILARAQGGGTPS